MVLKDGRFGPYVTDGETNASLRKGDTVEGITIERAAELLADRRAKGPAKKKKPAAKKKAARPASKTAAKSKKATTMSRGSLHRLRGGRGLRQVDPGPAAGRTLGAA